MTTAVAPLGVIGAWEQRPRIGDDGLPPEEVLVETPFGDPSDVLVRGRFDGRAMVFLARRGRRDFRPVDRVNHRANMWAMRRLGVRRVLCLDVLAALRPDQLPDGTIVLPDRIVDLGGARPDTPLAVVRATVAAPYCPVLRAAMRHAVPDAGLLDGAAVVALGPTTAETEARAPALRDRVHGPAVLGSAHHTEVAHARALGLCCAAVVRVAAAGRSATLPHGFVRAAASAGAGRAGAAPPSCRCTAAASRPAPSRPAVSRAAPSRPVVAVADV